MVESRGWLQGVMVEGACCEVCRQHCRAAICNFALWCRSLLGGINACLCRICIFARHLWAGLGCWMLRPAAVIDVSTVAVTLVAQMHVHCCSEGSV